MVSLYVYTDTPSQGPDAPLLLWRGHRGPLGMATKPESPGFSHRIALSKWPEMGTTCQEEKREGPDDTGGKTAPANRGGARVQVPLIDIVLVDSVGHRGPVSIIRPRYRGL